MILYVGDSFKNYMYSQKGMVMHNKAELNAAHRFDEFNFLNFVVEMVAIINCGFLGMLKKVP